METFSALLALPLSVSLPGAKKKNKTRKNDQLINVRSSIYGHWRWFEDVTLFEQGELRIILWFYIQNTEKKTMVPELTQIIVCWLYLAQIKLDCKEIYVAMNLNN